MKVKVIKVSENNWDKDHLNEIFVVETYYEKKFWRVVGTNKLLLKENTKIIEKNLFKRFFNFVSDAFKI